MPSGEAEIVRRAFEALDARGAEGLVELIAPDGVAYTAPEWVESPVYHGHDGVRELLAVFTDNFDDWGIESLELRDSGGSVVALLEHGGKLKGTDAVIRQPMGAVFSDFREGRIGTARFFQSWDEALAAAGSSR